MLRLLVKANSTLTGQTLTQAQRKYQAVPLFRSIGSQTGQGMAAGVAWHVLSSDDSGDNPWDACHQLLSDEFRLAGGIEFAEPDLQQRWLAGDEKAMGLALARGCSNAAKQDTSYPTNADSFWLRKRAFSQFDEAIAKAGPAAAGRVRVAHLDTGYDPGHHSLPAHMNLALQHNFVDSDLSDDATERGTSGGLANPGHGTGTLGLLAGKGFGAFFVLGGAPEVEVVPIRVANSVLLFYNSAIAQALDYVHGLSVNPATFVHVVTMSMGGLASQAWAEAVNALYEQGVFIVTAAGNNYANLPTRNIVYPARFGRVVAACGVMADHRAYADLALNLMAGNYGPPSKMRTALAACTPNTTWARRGCPEIIDFDGNGTSSATPQIAAAAALWIQLNAAKLAAYGQDWMRAEAVRQALFRSAAGSPDAARLGRGELKAFAALGIAPPRPADLVKAPSDSANFPFLDVLTGGDFGAVPPQGRRMLELEALQLSQSAAVEVLLPDPAVDPRSLTPRDKLNIADALMAQPGVSRALCTALKNGGRTSVPVSLVAPVTSPTPAGDAIARKRLDTAMAPVVRPPNRRRLQVFAVDPSLATDMGTAAINRAVIDVRWERDLLPGPVGEYIEVVDVDPASRCAYAPVDLNHPYLLMQDGLTPSEGDPQFHQQMTYAVAMRTIERFERALGRSALWAPQPGEIRGMKDSYIQRLRIYPHAIRAANAFYSPDRKALLLGYFTAAGDSAGLGLPHGVYFAALSHDVIAHETTHALLDGLHRRFREPTNPDVLAFHEAFADIVALFQHFNLPEALKHQIRKTAGDLSQESLLSQLAVEFGQAMNGNYGALRDAIGRTDKHGKWNPAKVMRSDYDPSKEPHALGSVLVSAVFAAFLSIYQGRTADLVRLATSGTGILPPGEIPVDLADRMADEASKVAGQVLAMCIRALDYCPPVDITFGDYLRALITADRDLVPDDPRGYRTAFAAAFRDRGILPPGVRHLSPANLVWDPPVLGLDNLASVLGKMELTWNLDGDREKAYEASQHNAAIFHAWLVSREHVSDEQLTALGFVRETSPKTIPLADGISIDGTIGGIEVHSVRPARRVGPDGQSQTDLVVEITQTWRPAIRDGTSYRGGCTLLIDLKSTTVRYVVTKKLMGAGRIATQRDYRSRMNENLRACYFGGPPAGREPFAFLHGMS